MDDSDTLLPLAVDGAFLRIIHTESQGIEVESAGVVRVAID